MSENSLIPTELKEKIEEAMIFFFSLREISFSNDEEYENGTEKCRQAKDFINIIEKRRKELILPFEKEIEKINNPCLDVVKKLKTSECVMKEGMAEYFKQKERSRLESQLKLEAEANERRRQETEKVRKETEKANAYREQGRNEMADKAEARAATAAIMVHSIVPAIVENGARTKGTTFTKKWEVNIFDLKKAVRFCIDNDILSRYVTLDMRGLQKLVNAQKGQILIDGIKIIEDFQVGVKTRF